MALIWNTERPIEIRDDRGVVVSVAYACGGRGKKSRRIVFLRPHEVKRLRKQVETKRRAKT